MTYHYHSSFELFQLDLNYTSHLYIMMYNEHVVRYFELDVQVIQFEHVLHVNM